MSTHAFNSSQCNDSSVAGPDFSTRHDELLRQNVWLAGICLLNALTFLTIIFRSVARRTTTKQFRIEDYLMMISGALVIFPHWVGQIGWNLWKVDETIFTDPRLIMMFKQLLFGYYLVCSTMKASMCYYMLHIVPHIFRHLRLSIYILLAAITGLGIAISLVWLLPCQPVQSNFSFAIEAEFCVNRSATILSWILISVGFDIALICIPLAIVRLAKLKRCQRIALFVVFGSSVLGTIICLCRIWTSIYNFRGAEGSIDMIGTDMVLANLEILLYSIGASMSVISKKIISMLSRKASPVGSTESGHAMPDFRIEHNPPRRDRGFLGRNTPKTELPKKDPRSDPKYQMSDSTVVWDSLDKMKDSRFPI